MGWLTTLHMHLRGLEKDRQGSFGWQVMREKPDQQVLYFMRAQCILQHVVVNVDGCPLL